eukprot:Nitzschia sp. Nitz4//scaffold167_size49223//22585//23430//NITZ4_007034-RA/size49223-processed-gene-0.15-mRNA-1//1//CDS//3329538272//4428//frame0
MRGKSLTVLGGCLLSTWTQQSSAFMPIWISRHPAISRISSTTGSSLLASNPPTSNLPITPDAPPRASSSNYWIDTSSLFHDYYALRHGQSEANVEKRIASTWEIASHRFGLTPLGQEQAKKAGKSIVEFYQKSTEPYEGIVLLSSDLKRAFETAEIVKDELRAAGLPVVEHRVCVDPHLRERQFGKFDLQSDEHYLDVWKDDVLDPTHTNNGVESVMSVARRTKEFILEWDEMLGQEKKYMVLCVAHGDVLQILQTCMSHIEAADHRSLEHLETATLRPLM